MSIHCRSASAAVRSPAPATAAPGTSIRLRAPTRARAQCGANRPTNAIGPQSATVAAVATPQPMNMAVRIGPRAMPIDRASSSESAAPSSRLPQAAPRPVSPSAAAAQAARDPMSGTSGMRPNSQPVSRPRRSGGSSASATVDPALAMAPTMTPPRISVIGSSTPWRRERRSTQPSASSAPASAGTPSAAPVGAAMPAMEAASDANATPAPAPLVTPSTKGDAKGLRRSVWRIAPDAPRAAPAEHATSTASTRN